LFGRAKSGCLGQVNTNKKQENRQRHYARPSSTSSQGAKYIAVTQDTSPSAVVEVWDKYLFGRAKTGSLGQVAMQKKTNKKSPRGINPVVVLFALGVQNILRSRKIQAEVV